MLARTGQGPTARSADAAVGSAVPHCPGRSADPAETRAGRALGTPRSCALRPSPGLPRAPPQVPPRGAAPAQGRLTQPGDPQSSVPRTLVRESGPGPGCGGADLAPHLRP
jgi:hypothetical protein